MDAAPPLRQRLLYFAFDRAPQSEYREWTLGELSGPWWPMRQVVMIAACFGVFALAWPLLLDRSYPWFTLLGLTVGRALISAVPVWLGWARSGALRRYERRWVRDRAKASN